MGLAGSVHCLAMCGGASAALVGRCASEQPRAGWSAFHAGRFVGYVMAGALAASSVAVLARLGQWSPALRPLWTLAHLAAMGLGLWLVWQGRQPAWLDRMGRTDPAATPLAIPTGWQRMRGPTQAAVAGTLWFAWPCGLLQSALMVAALANGPVGGAAVMAAFSVGSGTALGAGQMLWMKLAGWRSDGASRSAGGGDRALTFITRLSGLALAGASAWALGHDLFVRFAAWCFS